MDTRKQELYFSTLTGIVMLIFMLGSLTDRELVNFEFSIFSHKLGISLNVMELLIPLAAIVIVLGMYRALRNYLPVSNEQIGLHLFLPFAVTLTIGFTLVDIRGSLTGWILLFITGAFLYLVLRFEYIACDPGSASRPVSIIALDGLCYAILLLFVIGLRANVDDLPVILVSVFVLCTVVSLKIYGFHIIDGNISLWAVVTGIVMVFAEIGLYYCPMNIISYGALMFLWYYTFTNLMIGTDREEAAGLIIRRILPAVIPAVVLLLLMMFQAVLPSMRVLLEAVGDSFEEIL